MSRIISVDFETFYDSKEKYSIKNMGSVPYIRDGRFDPYLISVSDGEQSWAGHPRDFNWDSLHGQTLLSHNAGFDSRVMEEMEKRGQAPKIHFDKWHCTANLSTYLCMRRDLLRAAEFLLGVTVDKSYRLDADGKHWEDLVKAGVGDKVKAAGRADALRCHQLWGKYGHLWPERERRLSNLTIRQCQRGCHIDYALLTYQLEVVQRAIIQAETKLPWMQFGKRPTSTKAIAEECRKVGIPCPPVKEHEGEEAYEQWAAAYGKKYEWVRAFSSYRVLNKYLGKLERIKSRLNDEGRCTYDLYYFGAHCMPGKAEVLTETGWEPLSQWAGGKIAQWNPNGGIQFLSAESNKFEVEEELLEIDAPHLKGSFTLGHTMPFFRHGSGVFSTCKAGDFAANDSRIVPLSGNLLSQGTITRDQMRLLVATQADGHWETGKKSGGGLQFVLRKERKIIRLKEILSVLSIPFQQDEFPSCPGQISIRIKKGDLPSFITPEKKIFGAWLLDSTLEAREDFLSEILLWDGHRPTSEYGSTIRANVEWAATLAHLCGRAMKIHIRPARGNRVPYYRGFLRASDRTRVGFQHLKSRSSERRQVFCPTTQTGFWLVRYEDSIYVTGNTGRWQSGGGLAMQTLRKEPIYIDCDGWLVTEPDRLKEINNSKTKLEWVAHVLDERALWVATPGRKFMAPDLSQIEPRVLAWLVKDRRALDLMARGYSPYQSHAETKMNWSRGDLKALIEAGDGEARGFYKLVKAQVLGLGFGCGWEKFITVAEDMAQLDITKDDPEWIEARNDAGDICYDQEGKPILVSGYGSTSKKVVKDYREQNPLICSKDKDNPGLWKRLDDAFRASVGHDFEMMLPSGRSLRYPEVKKEWKRVPDEERPGKWKTESAFTAWVFDVKTNGFRRKKLYGGLLTENLVQATARDVFGEGLLNLDSMGGVDVLWSVHDEAPIEMDTDVKEADVLENLTRCPEWIPGLPIAAEGKVIPHYKK